MLNKGNCFDFEIKPIADDHLHIHFNTAADDEDMAKAFIICSGLKMASGKLSKQNH